MGFKLFQFLFLNQTKARNEPDVYETVYQPSLVEKVDLGPSEDDSANVQKINISTQECRDKFNTGYLNSDYAGELNLIVCS